MIIGKINVGASYEDGIPRWLKCDIDATPEPGETPEQVLDKIKQIIDGWQKANSPLNLFSQSGVPQAATPVINRADQRLMDLLEDCTTLEELNKYLPDVKAAASPQVSQVWDKMGTKLFSANRNKPKLP